MIIVIEPFAAAREKLGFTSMKNETNAQTVAELVKELSTEYPEAKEILENSRYAINDEYVDIEARLVDGCELAIIPPVSGGVPRAVISEEDINLNRALEEVSDLEVGAVVHFVGTVRATNHGAKVTGIDYEAKTKMAIKVLEELIAQALEKFGIIDAFIQHRIGWVPTGEASVVIAVSAAHRKEAYDANEWLLDELKQIAPIWKREERETENGIEKVWIGTGGG